MATIPEIKHLADEEMGAEVIPLRAGDPPVPAEERDGGASSLAVFLPEAAKAMGAAVLVCPGGGYGFIANNHEGVQVAEWFNARGVAAFVLRYRHAPYHRHPAPLEDAQRAMRMIRARAAEWRVDPGRIGVMGFSAGGHLAATLGTHHDVGNPAAADPVERLSCRPDFLILCYPVITTCPPHAHVGSRNNLLGENPDPALVELMANERQVTADTPPAFLFHTDNDAGVPPENSVLFYLALKKAGVPAELHIYADGPHGIGLGLHDPVIGSWPERLTDWLRVRNII